MKFASWNVNGLRACLKKDFMASYAKLDADIFAIQETKMQEGQAIIDIKECSQYWNSAEKKGYSGTAVFTKIQPRSVTYGIGIDEHDHEGRVITLGFTDFYFVNVYTPNSRNLERLDYRLTWEDAFREYLQKLDLIKPVIICGDLNVAHKEIDLKNPSSNHHSAGFTDEERGKFDERIYGHFQIFVSRKKSRLYLVVIFAKSAVEQCGLADRLFFGVESNCGKNFCGDD